MMSAEATYRWLINCSARTAHDPFDIHVVACIFALAISEAEESGTEISNGIGLEGQPLLTIGGTLFPEAREFFDEHAGSGTSLLIDAEEQSVRDILGMFASGASPLDLPLAAMIARRCKSPHHLWQDLGLPNRGDLTLLMQRHFERLAAKNQHDMKWKKFLYRMVCGSEGFTICTSPVCSECSDYHNCFGAEDGEARLHSLEVLGEHAG